MRTQMKTGSNIMRETNKKAIIYTRNSDVESFDKQSSSLTQEQVCRSYAVIHNMDIQSVHREQVSGSVDFTKRKIFSSMFNQMEKGSILLVSRMDRLGRNIKHTLDLLEVCKSKKIEIHSTELGHLNGEGLGRIIFLIMGVFAESERVMIAERSKATHNRRRKLGSYLGGKNTRFGFTLADDGKTYVENEEEQDILQRIFNLREDENMGFRQISSHIENEHNKRLHFSHINKLYHREKKNLIAIN